MSSDGKKKKIKMKAGAGDAKPDYHWIAITLATTFSLSMIFTMFSSGVMEKVGVVTALVILVAIILVGIIFDIIGVAVTTADSAPFCAMAIKKVKGSVQAIKLIQGRSRVSNFCNDVIGDICGIISGSAAATLVAHIIKLGLSISSVAISLVITGLVAALTVGGKAFGKNIAIKYSSPIVYRVAVIMYYFGIWRKPSKKRKRNK